MKERHIEILRHSLGLDYEGRGRQYRNHYCAGGDDVQSCTELVASGHMEPMRVHPALSGGDPVFRVTELGKTEAIRPRQCTMKDTIVVSHLTFVRAPAHENSQGRWDLTDYSRGQVLSIRLDTRGKRTECIIHVGPSNDTARLRGFTLRIIGRSRRAALLEALDLADYPLRVAGFNYLTRSR